MRAAAQVRPLRLTAAADVVVDGELAGTDLDGGLGREQVPQEIETIADLGKLSDALATSGFASDDVEKVMSGNWLRVIRRAGWRG